MFVITSFTKSIFTKKILFIFLIFFTPVISYSQPVETIKVAETNLGDGLDVDLIKNQKRREAQRLRDLCKKSFANFVNCRLTHLMTKLGAHIGVAEQQQRLGNFYYFGVFSQSPRPNQALTWFYHAANKNSSMAQLKMYAFYSDEELQEAHIDKPRIYWLTQSSNAGDAYSQYALGHNLYKGNLVEKDVEKRVQLMRKASAAGNTYATKKISEIYLSSLNTLKKYKNSDEKGKKKIHPKMSDATAVVSYFVAQSELRAESGNAADKYALAVQFHNGEKFYNDDTKAFRWMRLAAEGHHPKAQVNLGLMYFKGLGTRQDKSNVFHWISTAAEQDYPVAQFFLADMYTRGYAVEKDPARAFELLQKAVSGGVLTANANLANLYEAGMGVSKNTSKAESLRNYVFTNKEELAKDFDGIIKIF